jgi:hypothetical protein
MKTNIIWAEDGSNETIQILWTGKLNTKKKALKIFFIEEYSTLLFCLYFWV